MDLRDEDYGRLLELRTGLRRFLHWSEAQAIAAGITPAQHQLLLAIRGHADAAGPTIGEVAGYLVKRHNSVVELIDRASEAGLVARRHDQANRSVIRLALTDLGSRKLEALSAAHLDELAQLAPAMSGLWSALDAEPTRTPA